MRAFSAAKFRGESHVARARSGAVPRAGGCRQWGATGWGGPGAQGLGNDEVAVVSMHGAVAGGREDVGEGLGTFSAREKEFIRDEKEATEGPLNKDDTLASLLPLPYLSSSFAFWPPSTWLPTVMATRAVARLRIYMGSPTISFSSLPDSQLSVKKLSILSETH